MATFGEIQDRINNDFLNRTDLTAETARAVRAAIRYYERKRWWFTESATALATVASQSHIAAPSRLFTIDWLRFFYATSASYALKQIDMDALLGMRAGAQAYGDPTHYALYEDRIELFPIPDSVKTVQAYGIYQATTLSATATTNVWTSAAEELITFHATKLMWATVLRDAAQAQVFAQLEKGALDELRSVNEQRMMHGIRATDF